MESSPTFIGEPGLALGRVRSALEQALVAAEHVDVAGADAAAVEVLRALADKADAWDQIVLWATDDARKRGATRPVVPQNDNVTLPVLLKGLDQLGLTPEARGVFRMKGNADGSALPEVPGDEPLDATTV